MYLWLRPPPRPRQSSPPEPDSRYVPAGHSWRHTCCDLLPHDLPSCPSVMHRCFVLFLLRRLSAITLHVSSLFLVCLSVFDWPVCSKHPYCLEAISVVANFAAITILFCLIKGCHVPCMCSFRVTFRCLVIWREFCNKTSLKDGIFWRRSAPSHRLQRAPQARYLTELVFYSEIRRESSIRLWKCGQSTNRFCKIKFNHSHFCVQNVILQQKILYL